MVRFTNNNYIDNLQLGPSDLKADTGERIRVSYNDDHSITFVSYTTKENVTYTCCVEEDKRTIMTKNVVKDIQIVHVVINGELKKQIFEGNITFEGNINIQYRYRVPGIFSDTYTPASKTEPFSVNLYRWYKGGNKKTKRGNKKRRNKTAKRRRRV